MTLYETQLLFVEIIASGFFFGFAIAILSAVFGRRTA